MHLFNSFYSVPGVVLRKTKETRTTGIDLKGKRTRVNDEPDGSTSQSSLRRSNYGRTAPLESQFTFPATAHDITNHHVASSSRPCNPKRPYSLEEQENLTLAVAKHGRNWQEIKETLKGTGRSDENWKQKWKEMMRKAMTPDARNKMDEYQKCLHILAAVVQFNVEKHSKANEEFRKWFKAMGKEDREKMERAEKWLDDLKQKRSFLQIQTTQGYVGATYFKNFKK
ncbi:uncharacterized protein LOC114290405 [Camellia sinensis]|uniref:uncharacterized protein LOC114290405 n=1 Tax=Camellia sinensis TaxID=4442 RepID=UPI001035BDE7|nr:uncharacterized protein LOC114290405 [Camellia sinensis]